MAAPTQAYPPWLTPVPFTETVDGVETTGTSVLNLPLTYFGPSIPLGPGWVFGGSTSPASIQVTPSPSTSGVSTTPSSISSAASLSSTTPHSSGSPTSTQLPTSSTSSISSSPPTSSSSSSGSSLSNGARVGIILGVVLGLTFIGAVALCLLCRRSRRLNQSVFGIGYPTYTGRPNNSEWDIVDANEAGAGGEPGDDAPRETAPFLAGAAVVSGSSEPTRRDVMAERSGAPITRARGASLNNGPMSQRKPVPAIAKDAALIAASTSNAVAGTGSAPSTTSGSLSSSTLDSAARRDEAARLSVLNPATGSLFFVPQSAGQRRSDEMEEAGRPEGILGGASPVPVSGQGSANSSLRLRQPANTSLHAVPFDRRTSTALSAFSGVTPNELYFGPASAPTAAEESRLFTSDVERYAALRMREGGSELNSIPQDRVRSLLVPPPTLNPDHLPSVSTAQRDPTSPTYPESPPSEVDESAGLLHGNRTTDMNNTARSAEWDSPVEDDSDNEGRSSSAWSFGLGPITSRLGRLSWFRRMESVANSQSRSRRSSRSRSQGAHTNTSSIEGDPRRAPPLPISRPRSGIGRPASGVTFGNVSRPQTRPNSGYLDPDMGLLNRVRARPGGGSTFGSGSGGGSGGSRGQRPISSVSARSGVSATSGGTIYHDVPSRPTSPPEPVPPLPHELDLGDGPSVRMVVDPLDMPVPVTTAPFAATVSRSQFGSMSSQAQTQTSETVNTGTSSSRGTGPEFPPGLVVVPRWDSTSRSAVDSQDHKDLLEDEPPAAGGDWNSLRSQRSDEAPLVSEPGTKTSFQMRPVQVQQATIAVSESGSIGSHHQEESATSPPNSPGWALSPRVSTAMPSHVHSGSGSSSSNPAHSQGASGSSSSQPTSHGHYSSSGRESRGTVHTSESSDGTTEVRRGPRYGRASLGAFGVPGFNLEGEPTVSTVAEEADTSSTASRPSSQTDRRTSESATGTAMTSAPSHDHEKS